MNCKICNFQELLNNYNAPLTKEAFSIACFNEDLNMIQILVDVAEHRLEKSDVEAAINETDDWHGWLFGNIHAKSILKQEDSTDLKKYLEKQKDYKTTFPRVRVDPIRMTKNDYIVEGFVICFCFLLEKQKQKSVPTALLDFCLFNTNSL